LRAFNNLNAFYVVQVVIIDGSGNVDAVDKIRNTGVALDIGLSTNDRAIGVTTEFRIKYKSWGDL